MISTDHGSDAATGGPASHVQVRGLVKIFTTGTTEVVALGGLDLDVDRGEVIAIVGPSGSGKSTLVDVLSGLRRPTAGSVRVGGTELSRLDDAALVRYRRETVGFVWQQTSRNLLDYLDAVSNVELPMAMAGIDRRHRRDRAMALLASVGMAERATARPGVLSGGEQQRVAIAVALAAGPQLLLADEPTGELDTVTASEVLETLRRASAEQGTTVLIVTHDPLVSGSVERTVAIRDGHTATEVVRRRSGGDGALAGAQEYAVVDANGRLQLPEEYRTRLGIGRRVRVELHDDHVRVLPDHHGDHA